MKVIVAIIEWHKEPTTVQVFANEQAALKALSSDLWDDDEPRTLEQINEDGGGQFEIRIEEKEVNGLTFENCAF